MEKVSMPKPDREQKKLIAEILSDLGKLFFAGGVMGYFIPGLGGSVTAGKFILALAISLVSFFLATWLIRKSTRTSPAL